MGCVPFTIYFSSFLVGLLKNQRTTPGLDGWGVPFPRDTRIDFSPRVPWQESFFRPTGLSCPAEVSGFSAGWWRGKMGGSAFFLAGGRVFFWLGGAGARGRVVGLKGKQQAGHCFGGARQRNTQFWRAIWFVHRLLWHTNRIPQILLWSSFPGSKQAGARGAKGQPLKAGATTIGRRILVTCKSAGSTKIGSHCKKHKAWQTGTRLRWDMNRDLFLFCVRKRKELQADLSEERILCQKQSTPFSMLLHEETK